MGEVEDITVNGYPVVISVSHSTVVRYVKSERFESVTSIIGTQFIKECHSLEEVNECINDPMCAPREGWYWDIQFQDKVVPVQKCSCVGPCEQWFLASDEVGEECKAVYP